MVIFNNLFFLLSFLFFVNACSHHTVKVETPPPLSVVTATPTEPTFPPAVETTVGYTFPLVDYKLSARGKFDWRRRRMHKGVDLMAPLGTPIYAIRDGTVLVANYIKRSGYGRKVIIDHGDGLTSIYAHTSENKVSAGDKITRGQVIALVGHTGRSSGNHLHFEVRMDNQPIEPLLFITSERIEGPPEMKKQLERKVKRKKKRKHLPR